MFLGKHFWGQGWKVRQSAAKNTEIKIFEDQLLKCFQHLL